MTRLLRVRALAGPNVWSVSPVLEARIDARDLAAVPVSRLAALEAGLATFLPEWSPRAGVPREARLADCLRALAAGLKSKAGEPGDAVPLEPSSPADFAFECREERLGRECLEVARRSCERALHDGGDFDPASEVPRLRGVCEDVCLGRATGPLVAAASARGIPHLRLDDESLVQLGHGVRRRRIRTSITEHTGLIAEWISVDKERTKRLLERVGVTVPTGRLVADADDAWEAACALGLPVAVKPTSADYGHGVGLNLHTREQVVAAYAAAREYRDEVVVERFVTGDQFRLTVVGTRLVAAVRRDPVRLTGDGEHTLGGLMEIANRDPRRGDDLASPLTKVEPDDDTAQVLAEQGFTLESVPPAGREVVLSRIAHTWAGAGVTDVTDQVHPRVASQCVRAARVVGLDVAGIDVIARDIARPLEEQGGAIIEVNAQPTIAFHFPPLGDGYRPVCEAIVEEMFPHGGDGRIPVAVVTGSGDRGRVGGLLAALVGERGRAAGRSSSAGLFLDGELAKGGDQGTLEGTRALLLCPDVEAAVVERDAARIREEGLGVDRLRAVILTRSSATPDAATDLEERRVRCALLRAVAPGGAVVLGADDHEAAALADAAGVPAILVGGRGDRPAGRATRGVRLDGDRLVLSTADGGGAAAVLGAPQRARIDADTLLAVGGAWAMGVPADTLLVRLASTV